MARVLPPLDHIWFDKYSPIDGKLTVEADRKEIERLVELIRPKVEKIKRFGYDGAVDGNGKYHGRGVLKYESGRSYEGDFQNGKFHGQGKMIYENYNMYEGSWENDKRHGYGTISYSTGGMFKGTFSKGQMHGSDCVFQHSNGDVYTGTYRYNKKTGPGRLVYKDAAKEPLEGTFADGEYIEPLNIERSYSAKEPEIGRRLSTPGSSDFVQAVGKNSKKLSRSFSSPFR